MGFGIGLHAVALIVGCKPHPLVDAFLDTMSVNNWSSSTTVGRDGMNSIEGILIARIRRLLLRLRGAMLIIPCYPWSGGEPARLQPKWP